MSGSPLAIQRTLLERLEAAGVELDREFGVAPSTLSSRHVVLHQWCSLSGVPHDGGCTIAFNRDEGTEPRRAELIALHRSNPDEKIKLSMCMYHDDAMTVRPS